MSDPVSNADLKASEGHDRSGFGLDFTESRSQLLIIEAVRLVFLGAILVITLGFQALQPQFINLGILFPVYLMLMGMFAVNAIYLSFLDLLLKHWVPTALLFFVEATFITGLIYATGVNQSIFLFLYLVNIILCGFVFGRRGAFILSLWTSMLFSVLMILGPEIKGQTLFFVVGLNNIAFFAVSFLSGILSEQLNFMGSELKARGKDLRALRNLNELILENIATGLLSIDARGQIIRSNRAAADLLDLPDKAFNKRPINEVFEKITERIESLNLTSGTRHSERFDWIYRNVDGEKLILEVTVSALLDGDEQLTGYVLAFQDLTKVRRLEFAVRQSEKMAAVGQLAAGIAHEIRNPLASISGSIQLLGQSFSSVQAEEQKLMRIVLKEIDRLNNLISEFLEYVRPDATKDEPVDITALVREVLESVKLNVNLRKEVEQVTRLEAKRLISGNRDKLKQALLNIIINGYQAMQEGGKPALKVSTSEHNGQVRVVIRDHGCGIEENRLRKIFEPFHTTKPKGTGLGLAVTHKIIENHGGKIFVESTKGVGTEFTLEFPARVSTTEKSGDNLGLADSRSATDDLKVRKRSNG